MRCNCDFCAFGSPLNSFRLFNSNGFYSCHLLFCVHIHLILSRIVNIIVGGLRGTLVWILNFCYFCFVFLFFSTLLRCAHIDRERDIHLHLTRIHAYILHTYFYECYGKCTSICKAHRRTHLKMNNGANVNRAQYVFNTQTHEPNLLVSTTKTVTGFITFNWRFSCILLLLFRFFLRIVIFLLFFSIHLSFACTHSLTQTLIWLCVFFLLSPLDSVFCC